MKEPLGNTDDIHLHCSSVLLSKLSALWWHRRNGFISSEACSHLCCQTEAGSPAYDSRRLKKSLETKCIFHHIFKLLSSSQYVKTKLLNCSNLKWTQSFTTEITILRATPPHCRPVFSFLWHLSPLCFTNFHMATQTKSCNRWLIPQSRLCVFSCLR